MGKRTVLKRCLYRWASNPIALVVLLAAGFASTIVSVAPIRGLLVANSDTLLPAAYADNLFRHPETIAMFQLSRLPSFVPDLALYVTLFAVLPSWQSVAFAYALVSYLGMTLIGGAIVGQISGRGWRWGSGGFLAASAFALLLEAELKPGTGALFLIFIPIVHSGPFTLSLAGLLLGMRFLQQPSRWVGLALFLIALLGIVSDKLFFGSFFMPLAAGTIAWFASKRSNGPRLLSIVAITALGCALGEGLDKLLFSTGLTRMGDFPINVAAQLHLVGQMLQDTSVRVSLVIGAVVALAPLTWWRRDALLSFWWAAGAVTALGFLGLYPLLYADITATRYVQPVWWWGVIVLTSGILRFAPLVATAAAGSLVALTLAVLMILGRNLMHPSMVLNYQSPITTCLAPWHERGMIHAGIAQYWEARPIEVSSDWRLQVEQVVDDGRIFIWGSNPFYYTHDLSHPTQAPTFDFIVMRDLVSADITARFGKPDQVIECPGTEVWIYDMPGGFGRLIGNMKLVNERYGVLVGPACFRSRDFTTRAGPLQPDGITVPETAVPHDIDVWGPYVRLRAGSWLLHFVYRLDVVGPAIRDWDVGVDGGRVVLQAGHLEAGGPARVVKDITLTVDRDTSPLELRSMLQPGDRFQIESFGVSPVGISNPCEL